MANFTKLFFFFSDDPILTTFPYSQYIKECVCISPYKIEKYGNFNPHVYRQNVQVVNSQRIGVKRNSKGRKRKRERSKGC